MLTDAAMTVAWQEPVSAVFAHFKQRELRGDLRELEKTPPTPLEQRALKSLDDSKTRMAFLARVLRRKAKEGAAVGRIKIKGAGINFVVVNGSDSSSLKKGPGLYDQTPFPGAPGTVGIAGHRTTYGAPFRDLDDVGKGDDIVVEMPYGKFTYRYERTRIVPPSDVSVINRVSYDRLVLSACHPLYSAEKRIVVFAKLVKAEPRGAARGATRPEPKRTSPKAADVDYGSIDLGKKGSGGLSNRFPDRP